jgi:hypothetical protein
MWILQQLVYTGPKLDIPTQRTGLVAMDGQYGVHLSKARQRFDYPYYRSAYAFLPPTRDTSILGFYL